VQRLYEDVAFRALAARNRPDFRTLSDFRKIHLKALEGLFEQVRRMAPANAAMKLGRVASQGFMEGASIFFLGRPPS